LSGVVWLHFVCGAARHCRTIILGCNARKKRFPLGDHLKEICQLWAETRQKATGWVLEAG